MMREISNATIDWNPLGEVYYRKEELYSMLWKDRVDLNKYMVASGTYGGPIAMVKEDSLSGGSNQRPIIYIFTASGQEQAAFKWDGSKLVKMGWSVSEDLICVSEDGAIFIYDMFGIYIRQFTFGLEIQRSYVLRAEIFASHYGTGVSVLSGDYQFYVINNIDDVKVKRLQNPFQMEVPPSCWTIICAPEETEAKVLMAIDQNINELDSFQHKPKNPPISHAVNAFIDIVVSFNQKYVAIFADTGLLWIGSSSLDEVYCQYNIHLSSRPTQLVWCGSGAVVGYWDNYLMMVGPASDTVKYFVDSKVYLVQELDGVRIIGNFIQEFLQKVPAEVEDVYKLGSMKPAAMLMDASKEYHSYSPRVDDYLRAVKEHLHEAVTDCLRAAGHMFDEKEQRDLMRAASFGKSFVQDLRPQVFVEMAHTIRILNNIRNFKIGIPITYDQLQRLTLPVLIDRLIARRFFFIAVKICNYMKIPKKEGVSRVLAHWACYKVQQDTVDEHELAREIAKKLGDTPGISYTEIATKAYNRGKSALAIELLDYEPRSAEQVPLLMKMGKTDVALQKAIESGETELIYSVTTHMRDHLPSTEFLMKIRLYPAAASLLTKICKTQDRSFLTKLYIQDDKFQNIGALYIQESFVEKNLDSRIKGLDKARIEFGKAQDPFKAQLTEENIRLLEFQSRLQDDHADQFLNESVGDTLYKLVHKGYYKKADQLKKEFAIPDIRFWWTKIHALGASHAWKELEAFSKSKKSPIGYEPFVEACYKFGNNKEQAERYIGKVPLERRVRLYVKIGSFAEAAEAAFQLKSNEELSFVASKAGNNRAVQEKVNVYRAQLAQGVPGFSLKGKGFSLG